MRSILAVFGIYVLALLLASTFPVGAGDPVHGGALVHPAFPHTHTAPGSALAAPTRASVSAHAAARQPNFNFFTPAFDASAGTASEGPGTAITPPVPRPTQGVIPLFAVRLIAHERPWPAGRLDPPPDPPPPTPFVVA